MQTTKCNVQVRPTALLALSALCTLNSALPSCAKPVEEHHGRNQDTIVEAYGSRLEAKLPRSASILAARAAAEQTLRARGYVITETYGTTDSFRIQASGMSSQEDSRRATTTIEAWQSGGFTRLRVDPGAFASDGGSRAILDDLLARLGV